MKIKISTQSCASSKSKLIITLFESDSGLNRQEDVGQKMEQFFCQSGNIIECYVNYNDQFHANSLSKIAHLLTLHQTEISDLTLNMQPAPIEQNGHCCLFSQSRLPIPFERCSGAKGLIAALGRSECKIIRLTLRGYLDDNMAESLADALGQKIIDVDFTQCEMSQHARETLFLAVATKNTTVNGKDFDVAFVDILANDSVSETFLSTLEGLIGSSRFTVLHEKAALSIQQSCRFAGSMFC
ncbi:MAG: hypothetical protein A2103_01005 [Gammaproteobacteria bacterium GWF2_41_13]|nr:MAG: hypothetical protein A2103_01005 [Gammaproteobacteria bacterium GWF2_41_13]